MTTAKLIYNRSEKLSASLPDTGFFGGLVANIDRGKSFVPVLTVDDDDWVEKFAKPKISLGLDAFCATMYHRFSNALVTVRVHNGGKIANMMVVDSGSVVGHASGTGLDEDETGVTLPTWGVEDIFTVRAYGAGVIGNNVSVTFENAGPQGEFDLIVWVGGLKKETWRVSRQQVLDSRGASLYIEHVINDSSNYIEVIDNLLIADTTIPLIDATPTALAGGSDGAALTDADYIKGLTVLVSSPVFNQRLRGIMTGGQNTSAYMNAISLVAKDVQSMGYASIPQSIEQSDLATLIAFRDGTGLAGDLGERICLRGTTQEMEDKYNGNRPILIPMNALNMGLASVAYKAAPWRSCAGPDYGLLSGVIQSSRIFSQAEQDILTDNGINMFLKDPSLGTYLWDEFNLRGDNKSVFSRVYAIYLFDYIERGIKLIAQRYAFKAITQDTMDDFVRDIENFLETVEAGQNGEQGITDFRVLSKIGVNNTNTTIASRKMIVDVVVVPVFKAEEITINVTATDDISSVLITRSEGALA